MKQSFLMFVVLFGSVIGEPTAERIKHEIGSAYIQEGDEILEMEVHGHNLAEGSASLIQTNLFVMYKKALQHH